MVTTHSAAGPPRIDDYEVFGRLADGEETTIWAANLRRVGGFSRSVAVKCLKAQLANQPMKRGAVFREAAIGATLDHPGLVQTVDAGVWDGRPYLVCALIRGWNLRSIMATASLTRTPIPLASVLSIIHGAADGAHYLHEMRGRDGRSLGLVHRAIDDSNLIVARAGYAKLIDFGSTTPTAFENAPALTGRDVTDFVAPELLTQGARDRRCDVFSLGVTLAVLADHLPHECPDDLRAVIDRATAEQPRNRFGNARDLQRSIEAVAIARDIPVSTAATAKLLDHLFSPTTRNQRVAGSAAAKPAPRPATRAPSAPQASSIPGLTRAQEDREQRGPDPSLGRTRVRVTRGGRSGVSHPGYSRPRQRRHTSDG